MGVVASLAPLAPPAGRRPWPLSLSLACRIWCDDRSSAPESLSTPTRSPLPGRRGPRTVPTSQADVGTCRSEVRPHQEPRTQLTRGRECQAKPASRASISGHDSRNLLAAEACNSHADPLPNLLPRGTRLRPFGSLRRGWSPSVLRPRPIGKDRWSRPGPRSESDEARTRSSRSASARRSSLVVPPVVPSAPQERRNPLTERA
jgi:hypothetical protein